jgi:hypothetical protein
VQLDSRLLPRRDLTPVIYHGDNGANATVTIGGSERGRQMTTEQERIGEIIIVGAALVAVGLLISDPVTAITTIRMAGHTGPSGCSVKKERSTTTCSRR